MLNFPSSVSRRCQLAGIQWFFSSGEQVARVHKWSLSRKNYQEFNPLNLMEAQSALFKKPIWQTLARSLSEVKFYSFFWEKETHFQLNLLLLSRKKTIHIIYTLTHNIYTHTQYIYMLYIVILKIELRDSSYPNLSNRSKKLIFLQISQFLIFKYLLM